MRDIMWMIADKIASNPDDENVVWKAIASVKKILQGEGYSEKVANDMAIETVRLAMKTLVKVGEDLKNEEPPNTGGFPKAIIYTNR